MNVAIVTVNYKTADLVIELNKSIKKYVSDNVNYEHFVVDNDSPDDSQITLERFIKDFPNNRISLLKAEKNQGYAAGNNIALRTILSSNKQVDYVWFLNPDTEIREGALDKLLQFVHKSNAHIVGSRLEDRDGTLQQSCFNFPSLASEFLAYMRLGLLDRLFSKFRMIKNCSDKVSKTDWLAGASFLVTNKFLQEVGLMDEGYFLYYEEVDYLLKASRLGFECFYLPTSRVYHAVGASTGISDYRRKAPRRPKYWFDSRRRYFLRNHGVTKLVFSELIVLVAYSSWYLRKKITDKNALRNEPPYFLRDFLKNSFIFRGFKL